MGADITGEVGTVCPYELVGSDDSYIGTEISGDREMVAIFGASTPLTWEAAASTACGANGWGGTNRTPDDSGDDGTVAIFESDTDFNEAVRLLDGEVDTFAGWIGLVPGDTFSDGWEWEDGTDFDPSGSFCNNAAPDPDDTGETRLALVKEAGGDWCYGLPTDAVGGTVDYTLFYAHFMCMRTSPDADDYDRWIETVDDDTDTE